MSTLKEFCSIEYGKALPERIRVPGAIPVYGSAGEVGSHTEPLYQKPLVVVGRKGNISGVHRVNGPSWVIDTAYAIFPGEKLDHDFLFLFLKYHAQHLASQDQSTAIPSLAREVLYNLEISLPPIESQRKITKKIWSLFENIGAGESELANTKHNIELYKQSVLNAAIQGKLVRQDPNDEPASKLLQRIRAEKEKLIQAGKLKKEKPLPPIEPSEVPFELPKEWEWTRLGEIIIKMQNGVSATPDGDLSHSPILRISANRPFCLNIDDRRYVREKDDEFNSYTLSAGDLVFTRFNGNRDLVGCCSVVPEIKGRLLYPDKLIRVRAASLVSEQFIAIAANTVTLRNTIFGQIKTTSGNWGISGSDLKNMLIPLPPVREQYNIAVSAFKQLDALSNALPEITEHLALAERLKQSILHAAFQGNLA